MGLKLRVNLFRSTSAEQVFDAYAHFYEQRGQELIGEGDDFHQFTLRQNQNDWTLLDLDGGWEWEVRREAQLFVSKALNCPGFLIFVYDGDYWGYEFFSQGSAFDHFVQDLETGIDWFPGKSCLGQARLINQHLAHLNTDILQRYLVHDATWDEIQTERQENESLYRAHDRLHESRNRKAQPNDQFAPFDECFVVDFLRFLGVEVELRNNYVTFLAPVWRKFWISKQNTHEAWDKLYRKK